MQRNPDVIAFGETGVYGVCEYCLEPIEGVGYELLSFLKDYAYDNHWE